MGYSTWFDGSFRFNKPVDYKLKNYIKKFHDVRHMRRDVEKIKEVFPNWERNCLNGDLGNEGEFFVGGIGFMGQDRDDSILDYNYSPKTQPGLWCQWEITEDGTELVWDEGEKFYHYIEWLQYMINNFFNPAGYILNGEVTWNGEDDDDLGVIIVEDNNVIVEYGIHVPTPRYIDSDILIKEVLRRGYHVVL